MVERVSIQDVARRASTSIATVSRVMNGTAYPVSAELRDRILRAIKELNYTPNSAAQRLRNRYSPVIGIVVRDISDHFFGEIARGATDEALKNRYLTFICDTGRNPVNEMEIHELLWKNRVRGIVLAGGGIDSAEYRDMIARQVERSAMFGLRLVANAPQGVEVPIVSVDFAAMMDRMTEYMVENGHRRIALVTGSEKVLSCQEHVKGFRRALLRSGIEPDDTLVLYTGFTEKAGYDALKLFLGLADRPTAICCATDLCAIGAMRAIHDAGLEVPDDFSLMGIGNIPLAGYTRPALTSIRMPRYEMGMRAVKLILQKELDSSYSLFLETELVVRDSVRPL